MLVILEVVVILGLVAGAFVAGMRLSDKYHKQTAEEVAYALHKQYARLKAGVDADDVGQPYVSRPTPNAVPPEFIDRLRRNKHATMRL